jgi:hypothetical protein
MKVKLFLALMLFILIVGQTFGQRKGTVTQQPTGGSPSSGIPTSFPPPNTGNTNGGFNDFSAQRDSLQERDTIYPFVYQYFFLNNPRKKYIEYDTTLGNFFKDIETARRRPFNMMYTGNNGAALLEPLFDFNPYIGFHSGLHQYDIYNYNLSTLPFYDSQRTMADMYFSQIVGNQGNFEVGAKYAQAYSDGTQLSINYRRIVQEGFYNDQDTKTTNFSTIIRFNALNRKLKSFIGFNSNINNESHSGGVLATDTELEERINKLRRNVQVRLDEADTRYDFADFFLHNEYSLTKASPDSSNLNVGYNFNYKRGYHKYSDQNTKDTFSLNYYQLGELDPRGIRNYISINQISNEFFIRGGFKSFVGKASLAYDRYIIKDTENDAVNDITAAFDGVLSISKAFDINTTAKLGLGENVGAFYVKGDGKFKVKNLLNIGAKIEIFNSQAGYIDQRFFVNDNAVYSNDFGNQFGNKIEGELEIPKIKLKVFVGQRIVNDYIYADSAGYAKQANGIISSTYIGASHQLRFWRIHLENHAFLQTKNQDYIPAPTQYLKSNLFYEGKHFKKVLLLRLGAEYIYIPKFSLPHYNAITGRYYLNSKSESRDFQNVDLYLSAKVSKLRLFVKWENYLDYFTNRINYLATGYPQFDANIRFGLRWLFLD